MHSLYEKGIKKYLSDYELVPVPGDQSEKDYHTYHRERLQMLWKIVIDKHSGLTTDRILEVAPWTLAYNLRRMGRVCDTLGTPNNKLDWSGIDCVDYDFDLFDIPNKFPGRIKQYPIVVAAEIIEHLPINMVNVFIFLRILVKENGYLIIQTPNAAALKKRVSFLFGNQPFNQITTIPGEKHIREFTLSELITISENAGFIVEHAKCYNYFNYPTLKGKMYDILCKFMPNTFKDGITLILKK